MQRRHTPLADDFNELTWIAMLAGRGQHQASPGNQRPEEFPDRNVETERRLLQHNILWSERIGKLHPVQTITQTMMGVGSTLGGAGRSRGEDHVGEVLGMQKRKMATNRARLGCPSRSRRCCVDAAKWQGCHQRAVGQQHADSSIQLHHVLQTLGWILGIKRQVGAAGLQIASSPTTSSSERSRLIPTRTSGPTPNPTNRCASWFAHISSSA